MENFKPMGWSTFVKVCVTILSIVLLVVAVMFGAMFAAEAIRLPSTNSFVAGVTTLALLALAVIGVVNLLLKMWIGKDE
jgi:hypothetical protein